MNKLSPTYFLIEGEFATLRTLIKVPPMNILPTRTVRKRRGASFRMWTSNQSLLILAVAKQDHLRIWWRLRPSFYWTPQIPCSVVALYTSCNLEGTWNHAPKIFKCAMVLNENYLKLFPDRNLSRYFCRIHMNTNHTSHNITKRVPVALPPAAE